MLVTRENNRRNRNHALALAGMAAVASTVAGWFSPPVLLSLVGTLSVDLLVDPASLPPEVAGHEATVPRCVGRGVAISRRVFSALKDPQKERFRQIVKIFLDEVRITAGPAASG